MNFRLVFEKLLTAFNDKDIRYALMGGFAMGLWGGSRSTVDLDFLVCKDDMTNVHKTLTDIGYELHHKTENVSQYSAPLNIFGGIDFIHAFRKASLEMLERAEEKEIFEGAMKVRTLIPEDIIGMKLQSVCNNPSREKIDIADIETLISIYGQRLNNELLKRYFTLFNMDELYKRLFEGEGK